MCPKCGGFTINEQVSERFEARSYITLTRCLNCSYYDDATMRLNRKVTGSWFPIFKKTRILAQ